MSRKHTTVVMAPVALLLALLMSLLVSHRAEAETVTLTDAPAGFTEEMLALGWTNDPTDHCECLYSPTSYDSPYDFSGMGDSELVKAFNTLDDATRLTLASTDQLPEAPSSYQYAEDYTIVPDSFYDEPWSVELTMLDGTVDYQDFASEGEATQYASSLGKTLSPDTYQDIVSGPTAEFLSTEDKPAGTPLGTPTTYKALELSQQPTLPATGGPSGATVSEQGKWAG